MTKKEKIYLIVGIGALIFLSGISIGITLVSKNKKGKNWSKRGVVIRFDR